MTPLGSTSGRWTAFVEPLTSRRQVFHLVRTEPARVEGGRVGSVAYEVELVFHKLENEGDWGPAPPTLVSNVGDDQLRDLMQAIVDEAAKLGIVASGHQDARGEIRRVELHLEDMRKLVFTGSDYRPLT